MKKQLSVFALHARAAIGRLALVLLGTLALDAAAYALFGLRMYRASLTGSALVTALRVDLFAGAARLPAAARQPASARAAGTAIRCGGCRSPETRVLLWSGVCNALCFACVWCVQLMASVGTAALHAADARYAEGAQGIFVDFYRSEFLHGLLPLADGYLWVRNVELRAGARGPDRIHAAWAAAEERRAATGAGRADRTDAAGAAGRVRLRPDRRASCRARRRCSPRAYAAILGSCRRTTEGRGPRMKWTNRLSRYTLPGMGLKRDALPTLALLFSGDGFDRPVRPSGGLSIWRCAHSM